MIVKRISLNKYNTSEFMKVKIYLRSTNNRRSTLIKRELYLVDELSTKILIRINIIKPKLIIIDLRRDIIIIGAY